MAWSEEDRIKYKPTKQQEYLKCKRWEEKNKEKRKASRKRRKTERRLWFEDYKKGLKCEVCGEDHYATIEFHHKNIYDKKYEIVQMVNGCYTIENIMVELAKCQVLCSNCHKKLHAESRHEIYEKRRMTYEKRKLEAGADNCIEPVKFVQSVFDEVFDD